MTDMWKIYSENTADNRAFNPLVSVVVPIYKVEKYLDRCVNSIVGQSYRNLNIILVDDGSPDRCPEICDQWAEKDSRIKVIHKKNAGLGMARNTGMEHAAGDYVCFIDSDDYIHARTIETAVNTACRTCSEIVLWGFTTVSSRGTENIILPDPSYTQYHGKDVRDIFIPEFLGMENVRGADSGIPGSACTYLISMELIRRKNWRFVSERMIISEDIYSMLSLFGHAESVAVIRESFYYYCRNGTSLTHTYLPDRFERVKIYRQKLLELCGDCGYSETINNQCEMLFWRNTIMVMKQEMLHHRRFMAAMPKIKRIVNDEMVQRNLAVIRNREKGITRSILLWTILHKCYLLCCLLIKLQNMADENRG